MPKLAAEFLHLLKNLNSLRDTLFDFGSALQVARLKSEEKLALETKMRVDLQPARSENAEQKEAD